MKWGRLFHIPVAMTAVWLDPSSSHAQVKQIRDSAIFEISDRLEINPNFNWYLLPKKARPDDAMPSSRRETGAHQAMWEPLFILDYATGELKGWLAESIESNEAMDEWTLKLREGVTWSDGAVFDADDVIYTVGMVMRDETLAAYEAAEMRLALKPPSLDEDNHVVLNGVGKPGENGNTEKPDADNLTVIFYLTKPDPRFALKYFGGSMFGSFLIMPEHKWPRIVMMKDGKEVASGGIEMFDPPISEFAWDKPIGTGPYTFGSFDTTNQQVIWNRNDNWWATESGFQSDLPEPNQLIWQFVPSLEESKKSLVAGDLDAAREYSKADFDDVRTQNPRIVGWSTPAPPLGPPGATPAAASEEQAGDTSLAWNEPCIRQLEINTKVAPWNNVKARRALTYMIDRDRLATVGYGGTTVPSRTMFVQYGSMEPFIKAIEDAGKNFPATPDSAEAKSLLEDPSVGYKLGTDNQYRDSDGNTLQAVIAVNKDIAKDQAAAADLVAQLKSQGLDARLELLSNGDYWGRNIPTGDFALAYGWLSCGSIAEPYTSMARYRMDGVPAVGSHSPYFNNTGRWDSQGNKDYAAKLDEIEPLKLDDPEIPELVAEAYAFIVDEVPFIPLVQTPRIMPFNTTHWTGWPSSMEPEGGIPMHSWSTTHQMIQALEKTQ